MFGIATTNRKIVPPNSVSNVNQFKHKNLFVTVCVDDFLARVIWRGEKLMIVESAAPVKEGGAGTDEMIMSKIVYDKEKDIVEMYKSMVFGRPIYYHVNDLGEFYSSTHVSLLREFGVPIEENSRVLPEFFVYRFVMPPSTLYKGIKSVVFGMYLKFVFKNKKWSITGESYFNPPVPLSRLRENPITEVAGRVSDLLCESLRPLGPISQDIAFLLSGGLDSSILFKLMDKLFGVPRTYSTGYPFEDSWGNIDKTYALTASDALKTQHTYFEVSIMDYLRGFIEAIGAAEEPLHHLQSVMFYLLFRSGLPAKLSTVVCGQGSEAVFGLVFHSHLHAHLRRQHSKPYRLLFARPIKRSLGLITRLTGRGYYLLDLLEQGEISTDNIDLENPSNILWKRGAWASEEWALAHFRVTPDDIIRNRLSAIARYKGRSLDDVLSILDMLGEVAVTQSIWSKLGEKNGRILYYPFTQNELLQFAYSIPWEIKLQEPKNVLRHVARLSCIPEFIIARKKSGFGVRADAWALRGGVFDPLVPLCSKVFDVQELRHVQSKDPKKSMTFWNMLNYSIWKRLFIYNESVEDLLDEVKSKIDVSGG